MAPYRLSSFLRVGAPSPDCCPGKTNPKWLAGQRARSQAFSVRLDLNPRIDFFPEAQLLSSAPQLQAFARDPQVLLWTRWYDKSKMAFETVPREAPCLCVAGYACTCAVGVRISEARAVGRAAHADVRAAHTRGHGVESVEGQGCRQSWWRRMGRAAKPLTKAAEPPSSEPLMQGGQPLPSRHTALRRSAQQLRRSMVLQPTSSCHLYMCTLHSAGRPCNCHRNGQGQTSQ